MMHKITFHLETTTPMFLSGADQNACELRAQSFRGALRYWTRAILAADGRGDGPDALKRLHGGESLIWGKEEGGSPVLIRVRGQVSKQPVDSLGLAANPGLAYLVFSAKMNRRPFIPPKTPFSLELAVLSDDHRPALLKAAGAFWCLLHFSGIGTRSRRGAGCMKAVRCEHTLGETLPDFDLQARTAQEWQRHIQSGLPKVFSLFGVTPQGGAGSYPMLAQNQVEFAVWKTLGDGDLQTMDLFGRKFQGTDHAPGFRLRHGCGKGGDYDLMKGVLQGKTIPAGKAVVRTAFGLPLTFRFKSVKGSVAVRAVGPSKTDRRASPLWVHFHPLANGKFVTALTWLKGPFMPGYTLEAGHQPLAMPDGKIIGEFLEYLDCHRWTV